jgi:hypothetical protein
MAQIILDSANNLIQGDFDTATLALRTRMQTSTTNATTGVYVVPNGSATSASVQVSNAADPTNASKVVVATNGATDTQIVSGANGSGSYLPLSFYTNNDIRFQMGTAGQLNVRTAPGTVSSGTSGQFLTSGGPGAGVSWTTAAAGGFSNMQVFASPGTFTTPATTTKIKVTVTGGGGNNGINPGNTYNGGGGGGGGTATYVGPVTASTGYAVTVGGATGTSSFGALASATGGANGTANIGANYGNGGAGGSGSAGTFLLTGGSGGGDIGLGGTSFFSNAVTRTSPGAGANGQLYGGGATAGSYGPTAATQFSGAAGVVIVEY